MKKLILTGATGLLLTLQANAQYALDWAFNVGDWAGDEGSCLAIGANDVYTAGTFRGTVNFDPLLIAPSITSSGGGATQDMYISSHTQAAGAFNWVSQIMTPTTGNATPSDIIADGSGNVYVTGSFTGTIDFDPGTSTAVNLTSAGMSDIFIAKYNGMTGALMWAKRVGSTLTDYADAITLDASSRVLISGHFSGTVDFNPDPAAWANKTSVGGTDIFFARYTQAAGAYSFSATMGSTADDGASGIYIDASANILICGSFGGTCDFNPSSSGTTSLTPGAGGADMFVAKYTSTGTFTWVVGMLQVGGSPNGEWPHDVVTDLSGNVYVTGAFSAGTTAFDPGSSAGDRTNAGTGGDIYLAKYNSAGTYQWVHQTGGSSNDVGHELALDGSNYIYMVGWYTGAGIDFNPGTGTDPITGLPQVDVLPNYGSSDLFIVRYHTSGLYRDGDGIGGGYQDRCYGIAATNYSKDFFVTGYFSDVSVDFDPDASLSFPMSTSTGGAGDKDIFIARYNWDLLSPRLANPNVISTHMPVYPNPANNELFIENTLAGTIVSLYSLDGKLASSETAMTDGMLRISTAELENGMYLLSITRPDGEVETEKIVVQH